MVMFHARQRQVARRHSTIVGRVQRWRDSLWWSALQVVGEVEGSGAVYGDTRFVLGVVSPRVALAAWAGPERAAEDRAGLRANLEKLEEVRHQQQQRQDDTTMAPRSSNACGCSKNSTPPAQRRRPPSRRPQPDRSYKAKRPHFHTDEAQQEFTLIVARFGKDRPAEVIERAASCPSRTLPPGSGSR